MKKEFGFGNRKNKAYVVGKDSYKFVLPSILLISLIIISPLLFSLFVSFTKWTFSVPESISQFAGFSNYIKLFKDVEFLKSIRVTFVYAISSVSIELILGIILALWLNKKFIGRGIIRSFIIIPMVIPPVIVGMFWKLLYNEQSGVFNYFLVSMGLNRFNWLGANALLSTIILDVWQTTPFVVLIVLAGLQSIGTEVIESAEVDGASNSRIFFYIELPSLIPYLIVILFFRLSDAMKEFDKIFLLTNGGPGSATSTLSIYIYDKGFRVFQIAKTAAISWVFTLLIFLIMFPILFKMYKRVKKEIT